MVKALVTFDDGHSLTKRDFMSNIDNELIRLNDTGDINHAVRLIDGLDGLDSVAGHAKARFLWGFNEWWKQNRSDESFPDFIGSTSKKTSRTTVKRYVRTWAYVEDNTFPKEVAERPMRELVPIAMTLAQGYDISARQWRKIELCSNDSELRDVLRDIQGKEPRKSATILRLERDGTINLWKGDVKKFVGYLNLREAETDEDIAKAIEKIKSVGILEA